MTGSRLTPNLFNEKSMCVQSAKALPTLIS